MAFFACCREIYEKTYHIGVKKGTLPDPKEEEIDDIVTEAAAKGEEARGDTAISAVLARQNFALCFGCKPSDGVLAKTQMIMDVVEILKKEYSKEAFTVQFTKCFDDLKGQDANFEMIQSNTL